MKDQHDLFFYKDEKRHALMSWLFIRNKDI